MAQGEQEISWSVVTHEHKDRSPDWYWAVGLIGIAGAILSVFLGNIMFAVIIVLGLGSIAYLAARGPREHTVHLTARGVSMDGTLYPYKHIHSFWVEERYDPPRLFLSTNGILAPRITIPLDDESHGKNVREYLRKHIEEEEQAPHIGESLAELLGL